MVICTLRPKPNVAKSGDKSKSGIEQMESLKRVFEREAAGVLWDSAGEWFVQDLRALADAIEEKLSAWFGFCPAGHPLVHKVVSGSWFHSSKQCSCCSRKLEEGAVRLSCKQCAFHLCQPCCKTDPGDEVAEAPNASEPLPVIDEGTCSQVQLRIRAFERDRKLIRDCVPSRAVFDEDVSDESGAGAAVATDESERKFQTNPAPSTSMPVMETKMGWCVRGVFEHQGLKMGLRQLNTKPEMLQALHCDQRKRFLLKEKLMLDLVTGSVELQTVHFSDLCAAQRDVLGLSVAQLVQIRVRYDETYTGPQKDFLMAVENALYWKLGLCATSGVAFDRTDDVDDIRHMGRQAVLLVAAAAAIPASPVWAWWIADARVYFDTTQFACIKDFPTCGVLEYSDYSKVERLAGRMIDWQVHFVPDECNLMCFAENMRRRASSMDVSLDAITLGKEALRKSSE